MEDLLFLAVSSLKSASAQSQNLKFSSFHSLTLPRTSSKLTASWGF